MSLQHICVLAQDTYLSLYNKGRDFKDAKKIPDAIACFKKAIEKYAYHYESKYELGWCYNDTKEYRQALAILSSIPENSRTNKTYFELGYANNKLGYTDVAILNFNKCIEIYSKGSNAYKELAKIYYDKNDNTTALEKFKKAVELDTTYEYGLNRIGYLYNNQKLYNEAIYWLNKANNQKETAPSYNELGFAYYKLNQSETAIDMYRKAIALDSKSASSYKGIGDVYRINYKPAKLTEAIESYKAAIPIYTSPSYGTHYGLGWCYNELSKYDDAIKELEKAKTIDSKNVNLYSELGYAYYMKGLNYSAINIFKEGIALDNQTALCRYYLGLVYINQKDKTNAQKVADELKSINQDYSTKLQAKVKAL